MSKLLVAISIALLGAMSAGCASRNHGHGGFVGQYRSVTVAPVQTIVKKTTKPAVPKASYTTDDGRKCREDGKQRYTDKDTGKLYQFWVDCKK